VPTRFLVFGFWFLVFGFWFLVFGFWFLVFGFRFSSPERRRVAEAGQGISARTV
jgi:hypothetical protein